MSQNKRKKKTSRQQQVVFRISCIAAVLVVVFITMILLLTKAKHNAAKSEAAANQATSELETEQTEATATATATPTPLPTPEPTPEPEPAFKEVPCEAEDGTGAAGLININAVADVSTLTYQDGWYLSDMNAWYSPDMNLCYYNGWQTLGEEMYHFDQNGMLDRGWKAIGGQGYYFDSTGVYHPEKDPNMCLAFTFDDGPSEGTGQILDLCEEYGARVSFFLLGNLVPEYPDSVSRIVQDRCELGNHSFDHTQMIKISTEECVNNFQQADATMRDYSGYQSDVYRFPYGDYTQEQKVAIGKPSMMWSVDSLDWDLQDTQKVIDRVIAQTEANDIILMHDIYPTTIEACRTLFPYYLNQGYQLVTVRELAASKGIVLEDGNAYYGFTQKHIDDGRVCQ